MASGHPKVGSGTKSPGVRRQSLPATDKGAFSGYPKRLGHKLISATGKMHAQAGALNKHADAMIARAKGRRTEPRKGVAPSTLVDEAGNLKGG